MYIIFDVILLLFFITMCAYWHSASVLLAFIGSSVYCAVVSSLFILMFVRFWVVNAFAIASMWFHFLFSVVAIKTRKIDNAPN